MSFKNNLLDIFSKKKYTYVLLLVIILAGTWLRIAGIITNSFPFTYDVGRDMLIVNNIVNSHNLTLIGPTTGLAGLFYGPWWYYILSFPFFISQGNPQFIAFFMSFTGILTVLFSFLLGKKLGGDFLGLIMAYFASVSPVMIGISAQIWNPNLIPLLIVLVFLLIHRLFATKRNDENKKFYLHFLFLGFLLGLILDLEIVFGILFSFGTLLSVFILSLNKIKIKQTLFILVGYQIIFFPRLLFEFRHNFVMTKSLTSGDVLSKQLLSEKPFFSFSQFLEVFKTLKTLFDSVFAAQNWIFGFTLIFLLLTLLAVFYKKTDQKNKFYLKFLTIILATFFIGLVFFSQGIWSHYLIGIPLLYIFLVSLTIDLLKKNLKIPTPIVFTLFLFLFLVYLNDVKFFSSFKPLWEGDAAVYRNQVAVIDYIYNDANGKKFNYIAYTPSVHDYTYQYLYLWHGKKKYGYTPSVSKENLFYLIIEPDYARPFLLKEWFALRENDGKKINEKVIKGKILVEKRVH